jgi:hypothetical protein
MLTVGWKDFLPKSATKAYCMFHLDIPNAKTPSPIIGNGVL